MPFEINTITSVTSAQVRSSRLVWFAFALPVGLLFCGRRRIAGLSLCLLLGMFPLGCGSSKVDTSLRYTPAGSYSYQVTATSTTGVQLSQTVTLNLTVTQR